jgi:hypothetical protein
MEKIKFLLSTALVAVCATAWADSATVDMTSKVGTGQSDWGGSGTYGVTVTTADGRSANLVESYAGSATAANTKVFSQTISSIADGNYHVTLFATANKAWITTDLTETTNEIVYLYATSGDNTTELTIPAGLNTSFSTPGEYTLDVNVTNGTLELGMLNKVANMANWYTIQIKSLTRDAADESEARTAAVEAAKAALADATYANVTGSERTAVEDAIADNSTATADEINDAVATFKSVVADYNDLADVKTKAFAIVSYGYANKDIDNAITDILMNAVNVTTADQARDVIVKFKAIYPSALYSTSIAEGCDTRADYTSYITNPMAEVYSETADGFGWTLKQMDGGAFCEWPTDQYPTDYPDEAYQAGSHHYFNPARWGGDDWTIDFRQTTEAVPAGKYRLAVAARGSADLRWYRLRVNAGDAENGLSSLADDAAGWELPLTHIGSSGGDYGNGWFEHILDFELTEPGTIQIDVQANAKVSHQWDSFTAFRLTKLDAEPGAVVDPVELAKAEANTALENDLYDNVIGLERDNLANIVADENATANEINDALATFKAAKESYDTLADLIDDFDDDEFDLATADITAAYESAMAAQPNTAAEAVTAAATLKAAHIAICYSDAIAEGCDTRADYTSYISNTDAADGTNGWTLAQADGGATFDTKNAESPTDYPAATYTGYYFDGGNWNGDDWTTDFRQTTETIPAGTYRLAVAARGSADLRWFRLRLNAGDAENGLTALADDAAGWELPLVHEGNIGGDYDNGWFENTIDFELTEAGALQINVQANAKEKKQWQSFTALRLTLLKAASESSVSNVAVDADNAPATIYDLYGRRVANPTHGIYVVNGRKVVIK